MKRIAWQPRTRAAELQQLLSQRLQAWREAWLPHSHDPLHIRLETFPPVDADALRLDGPQGRAWFHVSSTFAPRLGEACLSLEVDGAPDLAGEMGAQAARALQMMLYAGNASADAPASNATPGDEGLLRHGALQFLLAGLPEVLRLTVDGAWCRVHASMDATPRQSGLLSRQQALAATTVKVTGQMALGEVSLLDSLGWSIGDVLVTDAPRDSHARLMVGDASFATARLSPKAECHTLILD